MRVQKKERGVFSKEGGRCVLKRKRDVCVHKKGRTFEFREKREVCVQRTEGGVCSKEGGRCVLKKGGM